MPAAQAQPSRASVASSLTSEILRELVLDVAIEEHRLAGLRRARAQAAQAAGHAGVTNGHLTAPATNGTGASPTKKDDGLYECLVCSRQIAAPRYASHLSGCMGLGGSRRGAGRAAAAAASGRGSSVSRPSSNGSDTDTGKANGTKRAASASPAGGGPKPKKPKPAPLPQSPAGGQFQPPHTGSHPLSKTMSLPASPLDAASSPAGHSSLPAPSASAHQLLAKHLQAPPMQARKSLPGTPAKSPASKRPQHPLAQSPLHTTTATNQPPSSNAMLMSDRPDSDSEDSDAEVQPVRPPAQKTPRVPPGSVPPGTAAKPGMSNAPGAAGGAPQKAPRKAMPPGRKAVAAVDYGSDSDDDVASAGSDSD
ncbi:hypothetical protein DMC30DRAFT_438709 [Rhodotorula diobovata]|uniref:SAGA-associated factor 11 n=1 Tax=Rhodotorula diobovata TaxID=5288 RepID=A0A5C5FWM1_9BASI|nr:hypothetical protein DMC30DRAFT_438709 [Rhodotorula diobovata]